MKPNRKDGVRGSPRVGRLPKRTDQGARGTAKGRGRHVNARENQTNKKTVVVGERDVARFFVAAVWSVRRRGPAAAVVVAVARAVEHDRRTGEVWAKKDTRPFFKSIRGETRRSGEKLGTACRYHTTHGSSYTIDRYNVMMMRVRACVQGCVQTVQTDRREKRRRRGNCS